MQSIENPTIKAYHTATEPDIASRRATTFATHCPEGARLQARVDSVLCRLRMAQSKPDMLK